jgi:hypothetical protein
MEIPMLDDKEGRYVLEPMRLYEQRGRDIESAKLFVLQRYFEVTGFQETNANAIWHQQPCGELSVGQLVRDGLATGGTDGTRRSRRPVRSLTSR